VVQVKRGDNGGIGDLRVGFYFVNHFRQTRSKFLFLMSFRLIFQEESGETNFVNM